MTFNEWFSKQKLKDGNIVEIAHDIAKRAWEESMEQTEEAMREAEDIGRSFDPGRYRSR